MCGVPGSGRGEDRDPEAFSRFPEAAGGGGAPRVPAQALRVPQDGQRAKLALQIRQGSRPVFPAQLSFSCIFPTLAFLPFSPLFLNDMKIHAKNSGTILNKG